MFFDKFFERTDRRLFQLITQLKPRDKVGKSEIKARDAIINKEIAGHLIARKHMDSHDAIFHIFDVIDQKASAMLTHISVMIAVNALLLGTRSSAVLDGLSVLLLSLFIIIALLSLRLLRFWSSFFPEEFPEDGAHEQPNNEILGGFPEDGARERPDDGIDDQIEKSFRDEIFYRGRLYRFSLNATTLLTFMSAILMMLYGIELARSNY